MINTLSVQSSLDAAQVISSKLPDSTLASDSRLYTVLLALSYDWIEEKAYRAIPTHVTYHSSLTLISAVVGIDRVTAWRSLSRLKLLGLVDWRSHKGKLFGAARNTGTVFQVRLNPIEGSKAKLSYHDLKHEYKDLTRLARCKRLSHQVVQHIQALEDQTARYLLLKEWTLKPYTLENPIIDYKLHAGLEAVLGVKTAQGKEVAKQVDLAAVALSQALQDAKSLDMYRRLMWSLKRRLNASQGDEFHTVYLQASRIAKGDIPEWKGLQRPGALLIHRLKAYRWYEECMVV